MDIQNVVTTNVFWTKSKTQEQQNIKYKNPC